MHCIFSWKYTCIIIHCSVYCIMYLYMHCIFSWKYTCIIIHCSVYCIMYLYMHCIFSWKYTCIIIHCSVYCNVFVYVNEFLGKKYHKKWNKLALWCPIFHNPPPHRIKKQGVVLEKRNPWNNFYLPSGKDSLQTSWFLIVSFPCRRTFYPAQQWFPKY